MCVSFEPLVDKQVHFNFVFCDDSFGGEARYAARASNEGYPKVREHFTITEKAPTRAISCLKANTSAFTFKTLLRHYLC